MRRGQSRGVGDGSRHDADKHSHVRMAVDEEDSHGNGDVQRYAQHRQHIEPDTTLLERGEERRAYLQTDGEDEVVDGLMKDFPLGAAGFADGPEGGLYCSGAGRGSDISKGGVTVEVVWPLEEEPMQCTVRASVELLDLNDLQTVTGTQVYEFPYQKVGEKWVFTSFESIF